MAKIWALLEKERRKREDESTRQTREIRKRMAKNEENFSRRQEALERANKVLAQSGFVSLVKELHSVVGGEVVVGGEISVGHSFVNLLFDRYNYTQKMINVLANQNGIIRVRGIVGYYYPLSKRME